MNDQQKDTQVDSLPCLKIVTTEVCDSSDQELLSFFRYFEMGLNTLLSLKVYALIFLISISSIIPRLGDCIDRSRTSADLIYIGPGDSTYSLFGHVAIRIRHQKKDLIYDLGISQSMGVKGLTNIAMGRALFHGEVRSFSKMLKSWQRRDRDVISYPLQLDQSSITRLWHELKSRVQKPVSEYLYDPLRENCATQIRQTLDIVTGGLLTRSIRQNSQGITTFRDDTRDGYAKALAVLMMIELLVGHSLDQVRHPWGLSYRPQTLVEELRRIRIQDHLLLGPKKLFYVRHGAPTTGGSGSQWVSFSLIGYLGLTFVILGRRRYQLKTNPTVSQNSLDWGTWVLYYLNSSLLIIFILLALLLTFKSSWLEVRNSWLLVLGSPLDICLLTMRPKSSITHVSRLLDYLCYRGIISLSLVIIISLVWGLIPPLSVSLFILMTWGGCFLSTSIIHSAASNKQSTEMTSDFPEDFESSERSWLEL